MSESKEYCGCSFRDTGKEQLLVIHIKTCKNKHIQKVQDVQVANFTEAKDEAILVSEKSPVVSNRITAPSSEEEQPFLDEKSKKLQLPVVEPRYHGPGCVVEVAVLEKHEENCRRKKLDNPKRNELEDRVGSYETINRTTIATCLGSSLLSEDSLEPLSPPTSFKSYKNS